MLIIDEITPVIRPRMGPVHAGQIRAANKINVLPLATGMGQSWGWRGGSVQGYGTKEVSRNPEH